MSNVVLFHEDSRMYSIQVLDNDASQLSASVLYQLYHLQKLSAFTINWERFSWRTAFGPKSKFYMGLRDIPVPPGGRRCGNNGADLGAMELTATVIPRSRRSRYTHIYMSLLYYRKWRPNGPRASTTSGIAHVE